MITDTIGRHVILKSFGKTFWFKPYSPDHAIEVIDKYTKAITNIRTKQLIYEHPRMHAVMSPSKEERRLRELRTRNYDQHKASFFCKNILAAKKVAIPLR